MKNSTTTQIIAKEGWKYIALTFFIFVLALSFDFLGWVFLLIFLFTVFLFRNPERLPAEDDDMAIISPVDGIITNISKTKLEKKEYIKVQISKSLLDASILRSPTIMSIADTKKRHGLYLPTNLPLQEKLGENVLLTCKSNYGEIFIKINAGIFSSKIDLFKTVGPLKFAQRFGVLIEGSIDLFLELDSRIKVTIGNNVRAGESVLGYFAHKGNK